MYRNEKGELRDSNDTAQVAAFRKKIVEHAHKMSIAKTGNSKEADARLELALKPGVILEDGEFQAAAVVTQTAIQMLVVHCALAQPRRDPYVITYDTDGGCSDTVVVP